MVTKKRGFVGLGGDYILNDAIVRVWFSNENEVSDGYVDVCLLGGHKTRFDGEQAKEFAAWFLREKPIMTTEDTD